MAKLAVVITPMAASAPMRRAARGLVDQHCGEEAPEAGADVEVPLHDERDHRAAEDGVRQAVADVAHAAQHDVDAEQAAERAGSGAASVPLRKNSNWNGSSKNVMCA